MADEKKPVEKKASKKGSGPVAKKDHVLHQNEHHFECVKGEPIPDGIPEHLMVALQTEGVID